MSKVKPSLKVKLKPLKKGQHKEKTEEVAKGRVIAESPYSVVEEGLFPIAATKDGKQRSTFPRSNPRSAIYAQASWPVIRMSTKPNPVPEVLTSPASPLLHIPQDAWFSGSKRYLCGQTTVWPCLCPRPTVPTRRMHVRKPVPSLAREEEGMPAA